MKRAWILGVFCVCFAIRGAQCIIGGEDAEHGKYPYQVSIRIDGSDYHWCGGAILNQRFIITSAMCASFHRKQIECFVIAGITSMYESGTVIRIDNIIVHPNYVTGELGNNIAMLKTVTDIRYTNSIGPVGLPNSDIPIDGGTVAIVTGYGYTELQYRNDMLKVLHTQTLSNRNCNNQFMGTDLSRRTIDSSVMCTRNSVGTGICHFDEGSPLVDMKSGNLIGIASWIGSQPECGGGLPDIYVRVYAYNKWIQNVLEGKEDSEISELWENFP